MQKNRLALLQGLIDVYERSFKPICKRVQLTHSALNILMFLDNHPECYTAKEISKQLFMKPSIVSFNVEKLVLQGYVKRLPVPEDRRQVRLLLTQKAEAIVAKGRQIQKELFASLTSGLSKEDIQQFQKCLDVLAANAEDFQPSTGI